MEKLIEKLKEPFDGLTEDGFESTCFKIAKELFRDYCISCDGTEYYFAEIEFYYWSKDKWDEKWNRVTYPRDGYEAGTLFYHLSGFDICFDSSYEKERFGGILVRSVMNENNEVIAGPLTCKDKILNTCGKRNMPLLEKITKKRDWQPQVKPTNRMLGKEDMKNKIDKGFNLCFYDSKIYNWNPKKKRFDKSKGCEFESKGSYNIDRFKKC